MGLYRRSQRQQWIEQALPRLGKEPDTVIAKDLGLTARQVHYLRTKVNKPAACRARWTPGVMEKLGTVPDRMIAEKLGLAVNTVRRKRERSDLKLDRRGMPPEAVPLLGVLNDMQIAIKFGRSYETALRWRVSHGKKSVSMRKAWSEAEIKQLGTMPDVVLARILVRRPRDVKVKREALQIPAFKK